MERERNREPHLKEETFLRNSLRRTGLTLALCSYSNNGARRRVVVLRGIIPQNAIRNLDSYFLMHGFSPEEAPVAFWEENGKLLIEVNKSFPELEKEQQMAALICAAAYKYDTENPIELNIRMADNLEESLKGTIREVAERTRQLDGEDLKEYVKLLTNKRPLPQ